MQVERSETVRQQLCLDQGAGGTDVSDSLMKHLRLGQAAVLEPAKRRAAMAAK